MWYKNKFIVCIGRLPKKPAIAIPSLALLTTEAQPAHYVISTKGAARVEKSQKMNTVEISPCVPFGHLVCGFPKGILRKVASLRSSREMTKPLLVVPLSF